MTKQICLTLSLNKALIYIPDIWKVGYGYGAVPPCGGNFRFICIGETED